MTRWLIILLIALPASAFAHCEADLRAEFSKTPDDTEDGFISNRVPISIASLHYAYGRGIFPWFIGSDGNGIWYAPPNRGVLIFDEVRISRSDRKAIARVLESGKYQIRVDSDFRQVITECALQKRFTEKIIDGVPTKVPAADWITSQHIEEYTRLHEAGHAHSLEIWEGDRMVGGLYGVFVNGYFSGESMFHKADDVTKVLYAALIDRLKRNGHKFIDTQQNRGLTAKWGGKMIPRADFQSLILKAQAANRVF